MNPDSIPQAEDRLLARLRAFGLLEPPADPGLDDLAALATRVADAAGAILLACDGENCRLIARHGVSPAVSKEILAAAAPFARDLALAVEESPAPAGSDSMAIRVVAGAPLKDADGTVLGAFCILDRKAHSPDPGLLAALESLARQAMHRIQARRDRSELARARIRLGELTNPSWNDGLRRAVIDALPAHVALLDAEGTILAVNRAWIEFGRANRLPDPEMAVGQNYLEVCRQSAAKPLDDAARVLAGIESVLVGERAEFSHEYPCDSPEEKRWFRLMVTPAGRDRIEGAVVMHIDITDRKRTEAILERERNLSDSIINSLPGVFYLFDAEGRFLRWNRNFETVTGYSSEEFARLHPLDLFAGSDKQVIADGIAEVFHLGASHAEASLVPKKGMPVPYYFTGLKVTHEGRPCLLGMGIDIADRKRVEQERDRLFNLSADLLSVAGFDGVFKQLNPAWERTLGISREALLSRPYIEFIHPDDRRATLAETSKALAGIPILALENRWRCHDGSWRWISWNSIPVPEDGLVYSVARDITEKVETDRALRDSEERIRSLVESARDAIFTLSRERTITSLNAAFESITGWPRQSWLGRPFDPLVHPEDRSKADNWFGKCIQGESTPTFELRISSRSGDYVPLEFTITPQRSGGSQVVGALGIGRDIRERRILEDQLRQAQRLESIGQLAAGVAHDFNNILTIIQVHASLLLADSSLAPALRHSIEEISQAGERAAGLTRQLLLFSRKQTLHPRPLDLNDTISNLTRMLSRILGEDIDLREHFAPELPSVEADPGMVEQVVMNLAVNARDAMPGGGSLTVRTRRIVLDARGAARHPEARPGTFACLEVEDTGTGVRPDHLGKLFDPFFTTKDVGKGTGLGLATVYGILQQHRGWIEVSSILGKGTTFRAFLPAREQAGTSGETKAAARTDSAQGPGGDETVLVVEDEEMVRNMVELFLRSRGYSVLTAANGIEAIEIWKSRRDSIDLLLTDMIMPMGISGRDLAERLRRDQPDLRVVFTSGYSPEADALGLMAREGTLYLQKPFQPRQLAETIRSCLDH